MVKIIIILDMVDIYIYMRKPRAPHMHDFRSIDKYARNYTNFVHIQMDKTIN